MNNREKHLAKRHRAEKRFKAYGILGIIFAVSFLFILLLSIFSSGASAFFRTEILVPVSFNAEEIGLESHPTKDQIKNGEYLLTLKKSLYSLFPEITTRNDKKSLYKFISIGAEYEIKDHLESHAEHLNTTQDIWLTASSAIDQRYKGNVSKSLEEKARLLNNQQLTWYNELQKSTRIRKRFNFNFFTTGDSRSPELAGIGGALIGSFYSLLICFAISFPLGIATAIYLEEFAKKGRLTEIIEININNLAAVPSIIFGLLGLAVILQFFEVPRSTPVAGGIVLALMTLPTIIISCRASLRAVPKSIRLAAIGMGASEVQVILHHVLPLALPGTLTGTIIGLAQALGETAPLLMIGMVAFIVDVPATPLDASSALPVQIYLWAESAERGFIEKSSAAIIVILLFLMAMNLFAVFLRNKYETRWS